jgi:hypothetical protein
MEPRVHLSQITLVRSILPTVNLVNSFARGIYSSRAVRKLINRHWFVVVVEAPRFAAPKYLGISLLHF